MGKLFSIKTHLKKFSKLFIVLLVGAIALINSEPLGIDERFNEAKKEEAVKELFTQSNVVEKRNQNEFLKTQSLAPLEKSKVGIINNFIMSFSSKYSIPKRLLQALACYLSEYHQFDNSGSPLVNFSRNTVGIMQFPVKYLFAEYEQMYLGKKIANPDFSFENGDFVSPFIIEIVEENINVNRLRTDFKYNIEITCKKLLFLKYMLGYRELPEKNLDIWRKVVGEYSSEFSTSFYENIKSFAQTYEPFEGIYLNVPLFRQRHEDQWSNDLMVPGYCYIKDYGCFICSQAMVMDYYHQEITNPHEYNEWLNANGGYSNGYYISGKAEEFLNARGYPNFDEINRGIGGNPNATWNDVDNQLALGHPVIIKTSWAGGHFVVIVGRNNITGDYYTNDPYNYNQQNFNFYGNSTFTGRAMLLYDSQNPSTTITYCNRGRREGTLSYWHGILGQRNNSYNRHYFYTKATSSNNPDNWAKWHIFKLPQSGLYEVQVFIPGGTPNRSQQAKYEILHIDANGNGIVENRIINQNLYANEWVSLENPIYFNSDYPDNYIRLYDNTGEDIALDRNVIFDAIRFVVGSCQYEVGEGTSGFELTAFQNAYNSAGGQNVLGCPKNVVQTNGFTSFRGTISHYQTFDNGAIEYIAYSPDPSYPYLGQAFAIVEPLYSKWSSFGFSSSNPLGYPTGDLSSTQTSSHGTNFKYQNFEGGALEHHTSGTYSEQVFEIHGGIFNKWKSLDYANHSLGLPTSDEREATSSPYGTTGRVSDFEGGHIHWHRNGDYAQQAFETHGPIDELYATQYGSGSWLGFPISDRYTASTGYPRSDFEGGYTTTLDGVNYQAFHYAHTVTTPNTPSGESSGEINVSYTYTTGGSTCSQGHNVAYRLDWGDGTPYSNWSSSTSASHSWSTQGTYEVKAQARCSVETSVVSDWSSGKTVTINPPPEIWRSPSSMTFAATEGGSNPSSQTLKVKNSGGGTLSYSTSDDAVWLDVLTKSGTSTGDTNNHTVSVDILGMSSDTYSATITITASGALNSPQTVSVTLTINPGPVQYTLSINTTTGGTTNPSPGIYAYKNGTQVEITAIHDAGYNFSHWTGDVPSGHENDNPLTIVMDSNKTLTANFIQIITLPEINIKLDAESISDGGSYDFGSLEVGTETDVTFTIENTGTADLTLSGSPIITITGADADQFSVQQQPSSLVASGGSTTFIIRFSPTSEDSKTASISISNNDADENPYDITLNGMGVVTIGSLMVTIEPQGARDAGAQWRRLGTVTWNDSGYTESGISAGDVIVEFKEIAGWVRPANQTATITARSTTNVTGTYTQVGGTGIFIDSGQSLGTSSSRDVALGDIDRDGDLDAFVVNDGQPNKVWLNGGTGTFTDSGQNLGSAESVGVALGDVDGDGDLDAFIANYGQPNKVWLNGGIWTFFDSGQTLDGAYSWGVVLGDVDGDGDLDAFVVNDGQANKVWLNDGNGAFTESGQRLGSADSFDIALGDVDGDGDLDAFVANWNYQSNKVWLNDGTGTFNDNGQSLGSSNSVGVALGDVDGDGDLDAFIANYYRPNKVWLNDGTGAFTDSGQSLGSNAYSFGVALGDVDGDGDLDAFIANSGQANKVWLNDGTGAFTDSGQSLGSAYSLSVALGDLDGDGDLDAFIANRSQPNKVWLNECISPTITTQPQSQTLDYNTSATLSVTATSTAPLSYQWYQGTSGDTPTPVGTNSSSYMTPNLMATTLYWVRVSNACGSVDSNTATITVNPPSVPEINIKVGTTDIVDGGSYDFGSLGVGTYTDVTSTIENTGTANLILSGSPIITITGPNAGQFSIEQQPTSPIPAGNSTTFIIRFSPTSTNGKSASISVANNDSDENPYDIILNGTGVVPPTPDIELSQSNIDFGDVVIGQSKDEQFDIRNVGNDQLKIDSIPLSGSSDFSIISPTSFPIYIDASASTTVTVRFTPSSANGKNATLTINSNDPDEPSVPVSISGMGVVPPEPEINIKYENTDIPDGGSYDFGSHSVGTHANVTFMIENTGTADLILSGSPIIINGVNADQFSVQQQPNSSVGPDGSTTFIIRFSPTSEGAKTASISIVNNDSDENPYDVILNGTAFTATDDDNGPFGKKCFIATATYGSPLHPSVKILRDFRDKYLRSSKLGRVLVNLYYKYSPFVAKLITRHKALKVVVRISLLPIVAFGYSMVHFGPIITAVMLIIVSVFPIFLILFFWRRMRRLEAKTLSLGFPELKRTLSEFNAS